jgi:hypothetical protein
LITFYAASNIVSRKLVWVEHGKLSTRSAVSISAEYAERYADDVNIPNIDAIELS